MTTFLTNEMKEALATMCYSCDEIQDILRAKNLSREEKLEQISKHIKEMISMLSQDAYIP